MRPGLHAPSRSCEVQMQAVAVRERAGLRLSTGSWAQTASPDATYIQLKRKQGDLEARGQGCARSQGRWGAGGAFRHSGEVGQVSGEGYSTHVYSLGEQTELGTCLQAPLYLEKSTFSLPVSSKRGLTTSEGSSQPPLFYSPRISHQRKFKFPQGLRYNT